MTPNYTFERTACSRALAAAAQRDRCADARGRRFAPALSNRRIGAAAWGRRELGPLARPIPRLEPTAPSASPLAAVPAAQPPPR